MRILLVSLGLAACTWAATDHASYRVRPGDTAWSLARANGLSVAELLKLNALESADLQVGQRLDFAVHETDGGARPETMTASPVTTKVWQRGFAVYYTGQRDAQTSMTAAHLTLPFGTMVRVTHQRSGKSVIVKINDRGPFNRPERIVDLSMDAARELDILNEGVAPVTLEVLGVPGFALRKP
ncbi:septal ring lytic transglycosylase RlpA family protein [Deinococcus peraridilitoris]|uniref:Probable endolytic peptidoglycan transglycosylase RlpA n=1 Tax=Deinococcus peraridilitoris (strain DSM 19664 / LMG 22246 / CIP 109416 / KR-200) TaxID=937777 RepID=L0A6R4_DEIPD|nr:septal ring lytic transglycosylase RlpA family protein [Deinococcus peraridilitoris]AFZ69114.1 rare lipoprotein A [Deinococcus peraridilitoris DSM 19664]